MATLGLLEGGQPQARWCVSREHLAAPGAAPPAVSGLQGVWVGVSTCATLWVASWGLCRPAGLADQEEVT